MSCVAQHLSSFGHSIIVLSGTLFPDQAIALGFRFVPLSGKANINYTGIDEKLPERAATKPGPEAMNAECRSAGIDPIPDQYRAIRHYPGAGVRSETTLSLSLSHPNPCLQHPCLRPIFILSLDVPHALLTRAVIN
jgi:hypothetical protein